MTAPVAPPALAKLLIVEDDADFAAAMGDCLAAEGYRCEMVRDGRAALAALHRSAFDLVISDVAMEGMGGLELLEAMTHDAQGLPVIVVSAVLTNAVIADARRHGAYRCLSKPYEVDELHALIERALFDRERERQKNRRADSQLPLAGTMVEHTDAIACMAKSSAPALLLGETGTGKELVARAIHAGSDRRERPFVAVNVSAIPDQLLESELFGHVRGAFTGAAQARAGLFVEADGGTLLLDEIGDMPLALQAKLLRVVQFGEIRPVGGDRTRHVDVRVIAATHRDLAALARDGRFRSDLLYRLNVLPLAIKPLRERPQDVAPLVHAFLHRARARTPSSPVRSFSAEAMTFLESASWPGNVRELESVVERLVVLGGDDIVRAEDLAFVDESDAPMVPSHGDDADSFVPLRQCVDDYVARVLEHTRGNKSHAAKILGVDLSTIYRWRRKPVGGSALALQRDRSDREGEDHERKPFGAE